MTQERAVKKDARGILSWLAILVAVALAIGVSVLVTALVDGDSRDDRLERVTNSIVENRSRALRGIAEQTLVECSRDNFQDAVFLNLLDESVKSNTERGQPPLNPRERKLLRNINRQLAPRKCGAAPAVQTALRERALTRSTIRAVLKREKERGLQR